MQNKVGRQTSVKLCTNEEWRNIMYLYSSKVFLYKSFLQNHWDNRYISKSVQLMQNESGHQILVKLCIKKEQRNVYLYSSKVFLHNSYIWNHWESGIALKVSAIDAKYYFSYWIYLSGNPPLHQQRKKKYVLVIYQSPIFKTNEKIV